MLTLIASLLLAQTPYSPAPPSIQPRTRTVTTNTLTYSTRAPHGHTHTCRNGHTWDHAANPTHTCKFCGLSQYVVDRPSRPVTIVVAAASSVRQEPAPPSVRPAARPVSVMPRSLSFQSSGGCGPGGCRVR